MKRAPKGGATEGGKKEKGRDLGRKRNGDQELAERKKKERATRSR